MLVLLAGWRSDPFIYTSGSVLGRICVCVRWNLVSVCEAGLHRTFLRTGFWIIKIVLKKKKHQSRREEERNG